MDEADCKCNVHNLVYVFVYIHKHVLCLSRNPLSTFTVQDNTHHLVYVFVYIQRHVLCLSRNPLSTFTVQDNARFCFPLKRQGYTNLLECEFEHVLCFRNIFLLKQTAAI